MTPVRFTGRLLAAVMVLCHGGAALGQAVGLHLTWESPAECPSATDAQARADRLVGTAVPDTLAAPVDARVTLVPEAPGMWRLTITTDRDGVHGERVLRDPSCTALSDVAAVILAMMVNPHANVPPEAVPAPTPVEPPPAVVSVPVRVVPAPPPFVQPPAQPVFVPPTESTPATAVIAPPPAEPPPIAIVHPPTPSVPVRLQLGAGLTGDLGSFPAVNGGLSVDVGLVWRRWRVLARGGLWLTRHGNLPTDASQGGAFSLYTGTVLGCFAVARAHRVGVDACAALEAGAVRGAGVGASQPGATWQPWVAPGAETAFRWAFSPALALRASIGASVPLERPDYVIVRGGSVFQPGSVVGRAGVGVEVTF